ncbi:MAG: 4-hydroxy-3-methylbut-2-enyl diphosphate reductase, partial [Oscillospiraceae bacterium]|nr:4-hydroxy-3-methylbut-2-enyl diphosphate reductase [Oscillospiraceae bacterium]
MKKLLISDSAGFCFGVSRSVKLAEKMLEIHREPCYSLGELIHNDSVVEKLAILGLKATHSAEDVPENASVIIRSHGVGANEYEVLNNKNCEIIDATCPKVLKIHRIVSDASARGRLPVIIGMKEHPEVIAICGWCVNAKVFSDAAEFESWLHGSPERREIPLTVVFQTTQTKNNLEQTKNILKKECTNSEFFDTICSATSIRQFDAAVLSEKCDAVVVIGARHSANSVHLAEICREHCANVQFITSADELDLQALDEAAIIGITAGASTPEWIIKEVKQTMTDELKIEETTADEKVEDTVAEAEMTFDQMLEESIKTIYNGDTVIGIVVAITPTEISL